MYVRKVNNYYFVDKDGVMVDYEKARKKEKLYLIGTFEDHVAAFMGTKHCHSSFVENISKNGEVTTQNTTYKLGGMSPDYQEFLEATRSGMRYLVDWTLYGDERQYYLTGKCLPKNKVITIAKIISQDGNYLLIQMDKKTSSDEIVWNKEERVFVCWNNMSKHTERKILDERKVATDIFYEKFEKFVGIKCKPVLK